MGGDGAVWYNRRSEEHADDRRFAIQVQAWKCTGWLHAMFICVITYAPRVSEEVVRQTNDKANKSTALLALVRRTSRHKMMKNKSS